VGVTCRGRRREILSESWVRNVAPVDMWRSAPKAAAQAKQRLFERHITNGSIGRPIRHEARTMFEVLFICPEVLARHRADPAESTENPISCIALAKALHTGCCSSLPGTARHRRADRRDRWQIIYTSAEATISPRLWNAYARGSPFVMWRSKVATWPERLPSALNATYPSAPHSAPNVLCHIWCGRSACPVR
jgi:hypothetical protein